jgi:hypothetical protein
MQSTTYQISVKGKMLEVPAFVLQDSLIVTKGRFVRIAEIFDEYWQMADSLPDPECVLEHLKGASHRPDLFTFAQRAPLTEPRFQFYKEWDNVAAMPVSTYEEWFHKQISPASRRNIRASEKKGVVVRTDNFDERYVRGIMSIYNESPSRAGRNFWHYGKPYEAVREENGTYRDRSTFLGAYFKDEMIGYMKIVWDTRSAAIMQILSKLKFRDKRPNNALLSEAVKLCAQRGVQYLLYERYVYGNKGEDSLTRFKEGNGFVRLDLPRYFVPLTLKGSIVLKLGLHRDLKDLMPPLIRKHLIELRDRWHARQEPSNDNCNQVKPDHEA